MSRVPLAQAPPRKQMTLSWTRVLLPCDWLKIGEPESALVVCAKKTCQSLGTSGEGADEPSHVTSTTPGLPATTHGCTDVVELPVPLSTCTADNQVGEATLGLAVLVIKA